jgi:hypothetical protein
MQLTHWTLGKVLVQIYDFNSGAAIYLPSVEQYETDTPCLVAWPATDAEGEPLHQTCLQRGFKNWLNVAVVSDTCDAVSEKTETALIVAFNEDCREGGWLWKMMNYKH